MAWIEPITTWGEGDTYTYVDWNRVIIDGDILLPTSNIDTYMMTENDVLTVEAWEFVVDALFERAFELLIFAQKPDNSMTADSFNALETLLVLIKEREDALERQEGSIAYVGDGLYVSHMGQYTDVAENYVR